MSTTSVVIPCFNLGRYLQEAVESVLSQTRPPTDFVVVDDGSTERETLELLERYRREGLHVIRTENRGAPAARNRGIAETSGEYVVCLDADDALMPDYLERTVEALDASSDAGIAAPHVEFFGRTNGTWRPHGYDRTAMFTRNCVPSASLFRRECWSAVGGYSQLDACQDWEFFLSIVERGWRWVVVPELLYRYRRRDGSISDRREANRAEILRRFLSLHGESYQSNWQEVFIEMDAEVQRLRQRATRAESEKRAVAEAVRPLAPAAQTGLADKRARLEALESEHRALHAEVRRLETIDRVRAASANELPAGARVAVVSRGDEALLDLGQCDGSHFPALEDGVYAGYHPETTEEVLAFLDEARGHGTEYLLIPALSFWWLEHYEGLREHLERNYPVVARDDGCIIFDVTEYHTFSVVICTYKRRDLLGASISSVFDQDYPRDRFELIVVDNDSPDDTQEVIAAHEPSSPIPFRSFVEHRNGLSFARNLGIEKARHEFVAFLDDDATASRGWLRSFNRVINEQHALVAGGRVEKAFEADFELPEWFDFQYLKHFFGVNYRDRGRTESAFRIRQPLYLGGGNSVYARRLFDHFPNFDTRLGRNGKSLLAAEESYLNLLLEQHEVPIFYSDDAYIHHFVDAERVTKSHLRRKAYWSGISNAVMATMFHGRGGARARARTSLRELQRLLKRMVKERSDPQRFAWACRAIYCGSFIRKVVALHLRPRIAGATGSTEPGWGLQQWIDEVRRWPDHAEKFRNLHELYHLLGDEAAAREAAQLLATQRQATGASSAAEPRELWGPLGRREYDEVSARVRQAIIDHVPTGGSVLVVSRGDDGLIDVGKRLVAHFPQDERGGYAGHYPADSEAAIAHLEDLRRRGADHLVLPRTAFWWLDHYAGLARHLRSNYTSTVDPGRAWMLFRLHDPAVLET